jgi:hypothetical protein
MDTSWSHFTKRIPIYTTPENVYKAWSTRAGLESWFLRQAVFLDKTGNLRHLNDAVQKGDRYIWLWHGWPDDTTEHREVLEANGKDLFKAPPFVN